MTIYGVNTDGTLSRCRAKPENRGVGRCKHYEHHDMPVQSTKELNAINEEILANKNNVFSTIQKIKQQSHPIPYNDENHIKPSINSSALNKNQFNNATIRIADSYPKKDWDMINAFYNKFEDRLHNELIAKNYDNSVENIYSFLTSEEEDAKNIRNFLGNDINLEDFSAILVQEVRSMRSSSAWRNSSRTESIQRIILTNVNNDMTKERYVASVLFFGGRCCYCNRVLTKQHASARQASGEHITPISPDDENAIIGGTRYGNMALACRGCNNDRANQDLNTWVRNTTRITEENKELCLRRINAFRTYALYKDYSKEESKIIKNKINELNQLEASKERPDGKHYSKEDATLISDKVKIAIHDLNQLLRNN